MWSRPDKNELFSNTYTHIKDIMSTQHTDIAQSITNRSITDLLCKTHNLRCSAKGCKTPWTHEALYHVCSNCCMSGHSFDECKNIELYRISKASVDLYAYLSLVSGGSYGRISSKPLSKNGRSSYDDNRRQHSDLTKDGLRMYQRWQDSEQEPSTANKLKLVKYLMERDLSIRQVMKEISFEVDNHAFEGVDRYTDEWVGFTAEGKSDAKDDFSDTAYKKLLSLGQQIAAENLSTDSKVDVKQGSGPAPKSNVTVKGSAAAGVRLTSVGKTKVRVFNKGDLIVECPICNEISGIPKVNQALKTDTLKCQDVWCKRIATTYLPGCGHCLCTKCCTDATEGDN